MEYGDGQTREHDESTGDALLDAAEALLAAGGPDAGTVRAVAGAVGVPTRAVYSLFGAKEGLVHALTALVADLAPPSDRMDAHASAQPAP